VVSGVGFLGAGAILRSGFTVKGLTTASSLWTTAIIGIASGSGYFELAGLTTVTVLVILTLISRIEKSFLTTYRTHTFKVVLDDRPGIINDVKSALEERQVKLISLNAAMPNKKVLKLSMVIRKPDSLRMDKLINLMNSLEEIREMEFE
jgi:putative Mg2+ transporter-C (MgtC) family protein